MKDFEPEYPPVQPGLSDPDWERYLVTRGGAQAPFVGDPTRWGVQLDTRIGINALPVYSQQILAIATKDGYSRSWSLIGNLTLPYITWQEKYGVYGGWDQPPITVELECIVGVGQAQIKHMIVLMHNGKPVGGLCNDQWIQKGGPYGSVSEPTRSENPDASNRDEVRSFAAIGALIGQSIAIRACYTLTVGQEGTLAGVQVANAMPAISRLAVMTTPHAAGEGL